MNKDLELKIWSSLDLPIKELDRSPILSLPNSKTREENKDQKIRQKETKKKKAKYKPKQQKQKKRQK